MMNALRILVKMIDRPAKGLAEVAASPRSWLLPAVLIFIGMTAAAWFPAAHNVEVANERSQQMIDRVTANMPEESARMVRENASETTTQSYMLATLGIGALAAALGWVVRGTLVHFSSMALGGASTWATTYAACVWTMLPFFVRDVVLSVYAVLNGQVPEHGGVSFLVASGDWLADAGNLAYAALSNVDPFALWHVVLLAIAIRVSTRLKSAGALLLALITWSLFVALKLIPVLLGQAVGGRFLG